MQQNRPEQTAYAKTDRSNTITCMICQAVYTPLQEYDYLMDATAIVLESAFMSMCHFCFRCRRPACPQCWDEIHGVCGMCVLEAQLPFRTAVTPLGEMAFPPVRPGQSQPAHVVEKSLMCIFPGRFQDLAPELHTTLPMQALNKAKPVHHATQLLTSARSKVSGEQVQPVTTQDSSGRQKMSAIEAETGRDGSTKPASQNTPIKIPTRPGKDGSQPREILQSELTNKPSPGQSTQNIIAEIPTRPDRNERRTRRDPPTATPDRPENATTDRLMQRTVAEIATRPEKPLQQTQGRRKHLRPANQHTRTRLEQAITWLMGIVLICMLVLIALAIASSNINTLLAQSLHIDIQAEIAYLWRLLQQLHA